MEYTNIAKSTELLDFVMDFNNSLDICQNVYLGLGTFPYDPFIPQNWKNRYSNLEQSHEIEIIQTALKNNQKSIIYFVDGQYRRIMEENGWIHIVNSINKLLR